jgi:hypothetical protein
MKNKYESCIVAQAILQLRQSKLYKGHWINQDVLIQLTPKHRNVIKITLDEHRLNTAFSAKSRLSFFTILSMPNDLGIFRKQKRYSMREGGKHKFKRDWYFYFTSKKNSIPPIFTNWQTKAVTCINQLCPRRSTCYSGPTPTPLPSCTPSASTRKIRATISTPPLLNPTSTISPVACKRKRIECEMECEYDETLKSSKIRNQMKWDSP